MSPAAKVNAAAWRWPDRNAQGVPTPDGFCHPLYLRHKLVGRAAGAIAAAATNSGSLSRMRSRANALLTEGARLHADRGGDVNIRYSASNTTSKLRSTLAKRFMNTLYTDNPFPDPAFLGW